MELNTPKRIKTVQMYTTSTPDNDYRHFAPRDYNIMIGSSPSLESSPCESPEYIARQINTNASGSSSLNDSRGENRRGRPRSEALSSLIYEGTTSPSAIKCGYCNRVFPREKSLQAHLRTHTGERPYTCDYPGCTRAFTQSGQLKTHQRLHTGERPFVCSAASCQMRFTHANRHCPDHPYDQLKRCDDFIIQSVPEQNSEVIKWLEKYRLDRQEKTPTRKTPKRSNKQQENNNENNFGGKSNGDGSGFYGGEGSASKSMDENSGQLPVTPNHNQYKSRKGLMVELDMNAGLVTSPLTGKVSKGFPKLIQWHESLNQEDDSDVETDVPAQSTFNPKKRWLREAWQEDLAKPLEFVNPNQNRPTVLMVASKDKTMPLIEIQNKKPVEVSNNVLVVKTSSEKSYHQLQNSTGEYNQQAQPPPIFDESRKWLGALALMELASEDGKPNNGIPPQPHSPLQNTNNNHNLIVDAQENVHHVISSSVIQPYTQL